jgi:hypothetical protein
MTCILTGTAVVGPYTNTGTVTGTPPGGLMPVSVSDPSHYFGAEPSIDLEKYTLGQDADTPPGPSILVSDTVTWTIG